MSDTAESTGVRVLVANHDEFLRFLGRRDLAEDILQDVFVRGLAKLETLRDDEAVLCVSCTCGTSP